MVTNPIKTKLIATFLVGGALTFIAFNAGGGNLEPSAPPSPTMHTLEDIYNVVSGGTEPPQTFAIDAFLKIEDIEGESQDAEHKAWIELLSFSHGVSQTITSSDTGVRSAGKVNMQDFHFVHHVDKASPKLALYCCAGKVFPKVEIHVRKAGTAQLEYMKITMSDLLVSSVRPGGSGLSDQLPIEQVSLNFGKIEWEYTEPSGASIYTGWDVDANIPIDPCGYLNPAIP